jgi:CHAD domain-containing protein
MSEFNRKVQRETRERLRAFMRGRERIVAGEDGEALHDFRVAFRQLRALLAPWAGEAGFKRLQRPLKLLKHKLAPTSTLRDMEVQDALLREISPELDAPLSLWLVQRQAERETAEAELKRQLARDSVPGAARQLRKRVRKGLKSQPRKVLKLAVLHYEQQVRSHIRLALADEATLFDDAPRWHALRLDCKRWRYLMESHGKQFRPHWLETSSAARHAQDALGRLRDLDLLAQELTQAEVASPGVTSLLAFERARRLQIARESLHGLAEYLDD